MANDLAPGNGWDRRGLPGWAYHNPAIFAAEKDRLFRRYWQIVGHLNDIPEPGDYMTLDILGERALVIRDHDGTVRGFHNICRHRGTRVLPDDRGRCNKAIICPFHGWAYNLDGTLRGIAERSSFPELDRDEWGLKPLDIEIWQGLVFVKFSPSDVPSVAQLLAPFVAEARAYGLEKAHPEPSGDWEDTLNANWKALRDIDNEGYHVRQAHPALHDLYGGGYEDGLWKGLISRSVGAFNETPGKLWSVRAYKRLVEAAPVPEAERGRWVYLNLFPNTVIGLYPDSVSWYREIPLAVDRTYQHGRFYRHADESREVRAARYLSARIDRVTAEEDHMLCTWAYEATLSAGYEGVILSDLEHGLKSFHDLLRAEMPELTAAKPPKGLAL